MVVCNENETGVIPLYYKCYGQHSNLQNETIKNKLCELIFGSLTDTSRYEVESNGNLPTCPLTIASEVCFYLVLNETVKTNAKEFISQYGTKIEWMLSVNPNEPGLSVTTLLDKLNSYKCFFIEVGPRPTMTTPFSTNAISAIHVSGITEVKRIEKSRRYLIQLATHTEHDQFYNEKFINFLKESNEGDYFDIFGDKMTECCYPSELPPNFFSCGSNKRTNASKFFVIDLLDPVKGVENLRCADAELALGFDESDFDFYLKFFRDKLRRNPTNVELFDLAQSNSEHSRHWFFKGQMNVDGVQRNETLFDTIQNTSNFSNTNNVIAFSDNSSAIKGFNTKNLYASNPMKHSSLITQESLRHIVYTAETHNFPTGVCPFPGAATGTGGRIRDVHATGRGAHEIAGVAGYSVGNLNLSNYAQPWEKPDWKYPTLNFAPPAKILLEASDGASDYGNKFGEPLICGFTRSFGMEIPALTSHDEDEKLERVEYVKPIMFSGGVGSIDDIFLRKTPCTKDQIVAKIGGPVYRIGVGGGAASSCTVQGARDNSIDFGAVQRGDPEMEHKLHRVIRSCIELGADSNPILSIHDQGAGGNGNVLKEIVEGKYGGAVIDANAFELGDSTISLCELWGAEYQESDAILVAPHLVEKIQRIAQRERCTLSLVGRITGDQRIILKGFSENDGKFPVDLNLSEIEEREPKKFFLQNLCRSFDFASLELPKNFSVLAALQRVLRLPGVGSKRFLTTKVDRSVTGLIAQQQCVGILQTPLADVAVTTLSYWNCTGAAVACGEQPIKGIIDPAVGARMSVGEALTNLVFAPISCLEDVKCSGNWMWAAKLPGEGARLIKACDAMCAVMNSLNIAVDGGKDSLSMAAKMTHDNGKDEIIKAPGTLVISAYAPCTDITNVVTPNFKPSNEHSNILLHLKMNLNDATPLNRIDGSALAQCLNQIGGNKTPDLDDPMHFKTCFKLLQNWINAGLIVSGHDISDGGLLTTILESAFAGNCGVCCNFGAENSMEEVLKMLFSEELGVVLEIREVSLAEMIGQAEVLGIQSLTQIGKTTPTFGRKAKIQVNVGETNYLDEFMWELREIWEETSDRMESLQLPEKCIRDQAQWRQTMDLPKVQFRADFDYLTAVNRPIKAVPQVAVLREEGSNGDREMAAAFMMAGFDVHDITMTDILESASQQIDLLGAYQGLALVGGFSYADVLGSARGWAASILYNERVCQYFNAFRSRENTFSLGVCNGCQLMALLGFVGNTSSSANTLSIYNNVFLAENESGRFFSGFNTVRIESSPSIFLRNMNDSVLGVWCSHGEGRFIFKDDVLGQLNAQNLICIRYCDARGQPTTRYPENPNGSTEGIAAICSKDGRHLAMMPHPDRSFLTWQCPHMDFSPNKQAVSPWIQLFKNAFNWSTSNY